MNRGIELLLSEQSPEGGPHPRKGEGTSGFHGGVFRFGLGPAYVAGKGYLVFSDIRVHYPETAETIEMYGTLLTVMIKV